MRTAIGIAEPAGYNEGRISKKTSCCNRLFNYRLPLAIASTALLVGTAGMEYARRAAPERPETYLAGECPLKERRFSDDRNMYLAYAIVGLATAAWRKRK